MSWAYVINIYIDNTINLGIRKQVYSARIRTRTSLFDTIAQKTWTIIM